MAKTFQNIFFHKRVQIGQIADHTRCRIHLAGHRDLHGIVVSVPVGVVALAVNSLILLIGQGIGMQPVRSREPVSSCEVCFHFYFFTTATASTSISHSGRTSRFTTTKVLTGGLLVLTYLSRISRTTVIVDGS